jgi:hypothetical protein
MSDYLLVAPTIPMLELQVPVGHLGQVVAGEGAGGRLLGVLPDLPRWGPLRQ